MWSQWSGTSRPPAGACHLESPCVVAYEDASALKHSRASMIWSSSLATATVAHGRDDVADAVAALAAKPNKSRIIYMIAGHRALGILELTYPVGYASCPCRSYVHARLRARRAPGTPCAHLSGAGRSSKTLARTCGEIAKPWPPEAGLFEMRGAQTTKQSIRRLRHYGLLREPVIRRVRATHSLAMMCRG
jgi:hypothetical protein